ncbi:hypothetical protein MLD38_001078 [Melastoma candidum]|uniref:Uncharacterized protein n=1 Tax=Melastoma candidum TaxID=119954 RepID=A0ACB9SDN9_9MYRT|nr:hypothetical protein MLD38_001078 [Melastoma candidum]
MRIAAMACVLILFIITGTKTTVLGTRFPSFVSEEETPLYVTITGCNNNCDTACCNCDITKQPPLCIWCCKEWR